MGRKSENGSLWGGKEKDKSQFFSLSTFIRCKGFIGIARIIFLLSQLAFFSLLSQSFPQIKSKLKNEGSVGLYTYPVLQAADILLYK